MVLVAGGAAGEMGPQAGQGGVGVLAGELEVDVAVELVEAGIAADLGLGGAEQPPERVGEVVGSVMSSPWTTCRARGRRP